MTAKAGWREAHDPEARPLGCNGKYGVSGAQRHDRAGEERCEACRESCNHYKREQRRGGLVKRRPPACGTYPAVSRHKRRSEPLDFACRVAQARYRAKNREQHRQATTARLAALHAEAEQLVEGILRRRRRQCHFSKKHTHDHCRHCGVHSPAGKLQPTTQPERIAA